MKEIILKDIIKYTKGSLEVGDSNCSVSDISINSKEITSDTIFVPIIGSKFDGHDFMEEAYSKGCRSFICDNKHVFKKKDINLIKVLDTTIALGDMAKGYRNTFKIPFVSITGSVGKTSTKDMIYGVLSEKFKTLKTMGNLNNEIGLPKTLFGLDDSYEMGVIEMGMDRSGEISYLSSLVNSKVAVITNIGMSHIEHFDNQEGIFKAKMELTENLGSNGLLIVNGDDKFLSTLKHKMNSYRLITCGFNSDNDIYCKNYAIDKDGVSFVVVYNKLEHSFSINNPAKHNILNALFSIAVALEYGLSDEEIKKGLLKFELSSNRLDIFSTDKYKIINDTYNASYDSMISALSVLNSFEGRKVAILGDIFELGKFSDEIHFKLGEHVSCDVLITIGNKSKLIGEGALSVNFSDSDYYHYDTKEDFYNNCDVFLEGDVILLKASHGMKFEEIVDYFKERE